MWLGDNPDIARSAVDLCEKYAKIKAKVIIKLKIMEFDEEKLKLVPEEEKRKFLLKDEYNGEDNRRMNIDEFLERRKKETSEETKKYEKLAKEIMRMEDNNSVDKSKEKGKIRAIVIKFEEIRRKDSYAAQRIFDIIFKKKQNEIQK